MAVGMTAPGYIRKEDAVHLPPEKIRLARCLKVRLVGAYMVESATHRLTAENSMESIYSLRYE